MFYVRPIISLTVFVSAAVLLSSGANASGVGRLPPEMDYKKICIKVEKLETDRFGWKGKNPATSGISDENLLLLAKLYYEGSGQVEPNFEWTKKIVDYLETKGGESSRDALQLKFDMLSRGRGVPQNRTEAKRVLDQMIKNKQPEAFGYYGDISFEEGNYAKAAEYYKQAFVVGRKEAATSLAYLYAEKKIPATDKEIDEAIIRAIQASIDYIGEGRCNGLTTMGLMYDRIRTIPKAEYYSAKWFEKAAELDEVVPKLYLAAIIQRGYVIPYDRERVIKLWKEAAALGSDRAMFLLGEDAFLSHKKVDDLREAVDWLQKASNRHNIRAMELLASLLDGRYPEIANPSLQKKLLESAVLSPNVKDKSIMLLADLYEHDENTDRKKIFDLYQLAARKGNKDAYKKLGDAYRYGVGVEKQPVRALRYYRLAADNGNTAAMASLAQTYQCGIGIQRDPKRAEFWGNQLNYYNAVNTINQAYLNLLSFSAESNLTQSLVTQLTLFAADHNDPEAMILLGLYAAKADDDDGAEKWFDKALALDRMAKEDFPAHGLLGEIFLEGKYIAKDAEKGVELLQISANAGNSGASNTLGEWEEQKGNMVEAAKYFQQAAEAGKIKSYLRLSGIEKARHAISSAVKNLEIAAGYQNIEAMLDLADGYGPKGWIGNPDPKKSAEWFDRAIHSYPCELSDIIAISSAYMDGKMGAKKDEAEAQKWLHLVSDMTPSQDEDALRMARVVLLSGLGRDEARRNKSLSMIEKIAAGGNGEAVSLLAQVYFDKNSSAYNPDKAMTWITRDAENGGVASMMLLSSMYMSGYSLPASTEKAIFWLKKAADAGNPDAIQRLEQIKPAK